MSARPNTAPPHAVQVLRAPKKTEALGRWLQPLIACVWTEKTAIKLENGGTAWTGAPLDAHHLALHIRGVQTRGVGLVAAGTSTTRALAVDFDSHGGETPWATMVSTAARVAAELERHGVPSLLFRSGGGRGVHLWALWRDAQDAYSVRMLAFEVLAVCGLKNGTAGVHAGEVEVFPKQDAVPADGHGNMIFLPFAGQSALLEPLLGYTDVADDDAQSVEWEYAQPVPVRERPPKSERTALAAMSSAEREKLRRALAAIPNEAPKGADGYLGYATWRDIVFGVMEGCDGDEEGVALVHEFSARSPEYNPTFLDERVLPYVKSDGGITRATVFAEARKHGWQEVTAEDFDGLGGMPSNAANDAGGNAAPVETELQAIDLRTIQPKPAAQRWVWENYIPERKVTRLDGDGGVGKSFIALLLAVCTALGILCFGVPTVRRPVIFYSAEDDEEDLRARLAWICHHLGVALEDLHGWLHILDVTDADPVLFTRRRVDGVERGETTAGYSRLRRFVQAIGGAPLLIVDNASDTFDGDEINRAQQRRFVRELVALVKQTGGAVLILGHVNKQTATAGAKAKGTANYSGSTAVNNSVRSRIFMLRTDAGLIELRHEKSNRPSGLQPPLLLRWEKGDIPRRIDAAEIRRAEEDPARFVPLLRELARVIDGGDVIRSATNTKNPANKVLCDTLLAAGAVRERRAVAAMLGQAWARGWVAEEDFTTRDRKKADCWVLTPAGRALIEPAAGTSADLGDAPESPDAQKTT